MGYSTCYSLDVDHPELHEEMWKYIEEHLTDIPYAVADFDGGCNQDCKWYEYDRDMKQLSAQFPDALFELHGEGESNQDNWTTHYKAGCICYEQSDGADLERYHILLQLTKELLLSVNNGQGYMKQIKDITEKLTNWKELEV